MLEAAPLLPSPPAARRRTSVLLVLAALAATVAVGRRRATTHQPQLDALSTAAQRQRGHADSDDMIHDAETGGGIARSAAAQKVGASHSNPINSDELGAAVSASRGQHADSDDMIHDAETGGGIARSAAAQKVGASHSNPINSDELGAAVSASRGQHADSDDMIHDAETGGASRAARPRRRWGRRTPIRSTATSSAPRSRRRAASTPTATI